MSFTYPPNINVTISNVKEIWFSNSYLPTFLHNVMKYPVFFYGVPYQEYYQSIPLHFVALRKTYFFCHSASAVKFCNVFSFLKLLEKLRLFDASEPVYLKKTRVP